MKRILRMVCNRVAGVQPAVCIVAGLLILFTAASAAFAQDEDDDFLPGLHAKYTAGGKTVARIDDDLSFDWGGDAPDTRLSRKRPFGAEWTGKLLVKASGKYTFRAFVAGEFTLELDGNLVHTGKATSPKWISAKPVPLRPGEHPVRLRFRTTDQNARFHLFWSSDRFALEPIPSNLFLRDKPYKELKAVETGRILFDAHRCNRCHRRDNDPPSFPGPDLTHVGVGLSRENLIAKIQGRLWLSTNPQTAKMPTFGFTNEEATAIAAFLESVSKPVKLKSLPKPRRRRRRSKTKPLPDRRAGELLVRSVGCLACHTVGQAFQPDPNGRKTSNAAPVRLESLTYGNDGPYAGGDLARVGRKRSAEWVYRWLGDPKSLNADHRMPVFKLTNDERRQIAVYLSSVRNDKSTRADADGKTISRGRKLVEQSRCAACHTIPTVKPPTSFPKDLSFHTNDQTRSCLAKTPDRKTHRPAYPHIDVAAVTAYLQSHTGKLSPPSRYEFGRRVLERRNCIGCHERDQSRGIVETAGKMSKLDNALRGQSEAMIPPSLNAVGDKLLDDYLKIAIAGQQKTVRLPWLRIRMPRFVHTKDESNALVSYLIAHDRIPGRLEVRAKPQAKLPADSQILVAGQTLLGVRGFSCIACHTVGDYVPRNVALGTRGSDLMQLAGRMRRPFFDRWSRNPIRIVPGMEMPSYHAKPVPGVLGDDVDLQLAVLWRALNDKRFKPPTNPSVVEQFVTVQPGQPARIIRDVFTVPKENGGGYVARSLAIGLNNGHNLLFDLDTYSLRGWFFGDFARQRTQGKSWYWDMAGVPVMTGLTSGPDIILVKKDKKTGKETVYLPRRVNGSVGRVIGYTRDIPHFPKNGLLWDYRLRFEIDHRRSDLHFSDVVIPVRSFPKSKRSGLVRMVLAEGVSLPGDNREPKPLPGDITIYVARPIPRSRLAGARIEDQSEDSFTIKATKWRRFKFIPDKEYAALDNEIPLGDKRKPGRGIVLGYRSTLNRERSKVTLKPKPESVQTEQVTVVPGFRGIRLPISRAIMPTAIAWNDSGKLVFTSLKGHVFVGTDTTGDGDEDRLRIIANGLAAPYGILAAKKDLIVSHKPELLRLSPFDPSRGAYNYRNVLATGWGYTDNYHDWTCGIVRDKAGNLYVGLGSDYAQPKRAKEHALWRGKVLRISPDGKIAPVGHAFRYPTGLAMNHEGEIFVSDNQGVQNTFNEINHLKEGRHYGVPSRFEEHPKAPTTPPAIQIPHPWTRSVNGIFFLPTEPPKAANTSTRQPVGAGLRAGPPLWERLAEDVQREAKTRSRQSNTPRPPNGRFPTIAHTTAGRHGGTAPTGRTYFCKEFAGHGIGCEYDNRFLIRFTLQKVDGEYQGACYAFSKPEAGRGKTNFLGPLCGGVAPDGAIYIGSIYDSGWLGGNNTGDIVRLVPNGKLPNGIRELRVTKDGFEIEFIRAIDRAAATKPAAYSITGYNRIWKGSYATPDSNRHTLPVKTVSVSKDKKTVRLVVPNRRAGGYLYEVRVGEIGAKPQRALWPATGYYTLHRIPK
jgi:mono/diheme cytochrome c family protein